MAAVRVRAAAPNPTVAKTNYSFLVDLSRNPADWWNAIDTTDFTRGRAYKGDGTTRLAIDWINPVNNGDGTGTGLARVLWSGTLATTGTQEVVIESPDATVAAVAAGDTYGQYAAYDASWEAYYPDGAGNDRTSHQRHLTGTNLTPGDTAGVLGRGTTYNGAAQAQSAAVLGSLDWPLTVMGWGYATNLAASGGQSVLSFATGSSNSNWMGLGYAPNVAGDPPNLYWSLGSGYTEIGTGQVTEAWHVWSARLISNISRFMGFDGSWTAENTLDDDFAPMDNFTIGALGRSSITSRWEGVISQVHFHSADRGTDWEAYERSQVEDQATFWGTWTVDTGGGTTDALTASDLYLAAATMDTPALGQVHAFSTGEFSGPGAVLDSPSIAQAHALYAAALGLTAAVLDAPALSTEGEHALTASALTLSAATLDAPAFGQVHALSAGDPRAAEFPLAAAVLDSPALSTDDIDDLAADGLTLSVAALDAPALGQVHAMSPVEIAGGTAALGSPALGQFYALTATQMMLEAAVLGEPVLWTGSGLPLDEPEELSVEWSGSVELSTSWSDGVELSVIWRES